MVDKYIFIMINIDGLTKWVLSVDRRIVVMKEINANQLIRASEIAEKTDRSLQNISRAIRELETKGLIECLTPEKHTWKRYILTEMGIHVFEKLKKNRLID